MYSVAALRQIINTATGLIYMSSQAVEDLLLGTAATESHLGKYDKQVGGGPALGIYQMEPATLYDIYENYLAHRPWWADQISLVVGCSTPHLDKLQYDPIYSTIMARLHYRRVKFALPKHGDIGGYADYWKDHYNTKHGKGTVQKFINDYKRFVVQGE